MVALVATLSLNLNAQTKKDSKDSTKTVIIFNSGATTTQKSNYTEFKGIIKVDPLAFISGKIPVSYERKLSDLFSVQVNLGLTSKNYLQNAIADADINAKVDFDVTSLPQGYQDETDVLYNYDHRKANLGYMFSLQPKVYISEEALEGSYFALGFNSLRFNYSTPGLVEKSGNLTFTGATKKEHETVTSLMVYFGNQRLYDRLSLEYFTGVGIRSAKGEKYMAGNSGSGFYEAMTPYKKKGTLNFELSIKLGFQL